MLSNNHMSPYFVVQYKINRILRLRFYFLFHSIINHLDNKLCFRGDGTEGHPLHLVTRSAARPGQHGTRGQDCLCWLQLPLGLHLSRRLGVSSTGSSWWSQHSSTAPGCPRTHATGLVHLCPGNFSLMRDYNELSINLKVSYFRFVWWILLTETRMLVWCLLRCGRSIRILSTRRRAGGWKWRK